MNKCCISVSCKFYSLQIILQNQASFVSVVLFYLDFNWQSLSNVKNAFQLLPCHLHFKVTIDQTGVESMWQCADKAAVMLEVMLFFLFFLAMTLTHHCCQVGNPLEWLHRSFKLLWFPVLSSKGAFLKNWSPSKKKRESSSLSTHDQHCRRFVESHMFLSFLTCCAVGWGYVCTEDITQRVLLWKSI